MDSVRPLSPSPLAQAQKLMQSLCENTPELLKSLRVEMISKDSNHKQTVEILSLYNPKKWSVSSEISIENYFCDNINTYLLRLFYRKPINYYAKCKCIQCNLDTYS